MNLSWVIFNPPKPNMDHPFGKPTYAKLMANPPPTMASYHFESLLDYWEPDVCFGPMKPNIFVVATEEIIRWMHEDKYI